MSEHADDYTIDELFSVCIARQIIDGEVVGQGIATPLVMAGVILARCTHAPNMLLASAIGQSLCRDWGPLGLTRVEEQWLGHSLAFLSFSEIACELLPATRMKEFFRPAQVDAFGNFNNVIIGSDYAHPRMRLPGSGGIADVTGYNDKSYLYVPRHSRAVFVEQVDFVSGLGHVAGRIDGSGPVHLISNLGQFDFANGRMRLVTYHTGELIEKIRAKTGFDLEVAPDAHETEPPTFEEVRLLREEIDPLGIRKLETLSGAQRKSLLREILKQEELHT